LILKDSYNLRLFLREVLIRVVNQGLSFWDVCVLMVGKHVLKILR